MKKILYNRSGCVSNCKLIINLILATIICHGQWLLQLRLKTFAIMLHLISGSDAVIAARVIESHAFDEDDDKEDRNTIPLIPLFKGVLK